MERRLNESEQLSEEAFRCWRIAVAEEEKKGEALKDGYCRSYINTYVCVFVEIFYAFGLNCFMRV